MWRLVHKWSFLLFWLSFDCFWQLVHIVKNSQNHRCTNRHRSTKTVPTVYRQCTDRQKQSEDSQNSKNGHWCTNCHIFVYQDCANSVPIVKNSQNSKNDHWCTNRHMSTQSPPNTQSRSYDLLLVFHCTALSCTILESLNVQNIVTLKSRLLEIAPFDWSHMVSYLSCQDSTVVTMS